MTNMHKDCEVLHTPFGTAKINNKLGYYQIIDNDKGNYGEYLHRLLFEQFYRMEIPKGFIIHHKDGNKTNNCILNLQLMSLSEHMRIHNTGENHYNYGGTIPLEQRIKIGNSRRGKGHTEETKKRISEKLTLDYARIVKHGISHKDIPRYAIKYKGECIKHSMNPQKLIKWFKENYPNEEIKEEIP